MNKQATAVELLALLEQPTVSLKEANEILEVGDWQGYKAVHDGTYPVPVIRIGRAIRVPTAPLRQVLHLDESAAG